jgi:hypothetical protein
MAVCLSSATKKMNPRNNSTHLERRNYLHPKHHMVHQFGDMHASYKLKNSWIAFSNKWQLLPEPTRLYGFNIQYALPVTPVSRIYLIFDPDLVNTFIRSLPGIYLRIRYHQYK